MSDVSKIFEKVDNLYNLFVNYFSPDIDESMYNPDWEDYLKFPSAGWINFWSAFTNTSLEDFILNIYDKIEVQTNPLHEDNVDEFNATLDLIKTDTFIGSFYQINDEYMPNIVNSLQGNSTSVITFETAGVSNSFYTIPAKSITIDMSWYLPYKKYGDMVLGGFMWLGFLYVLWKRIPDIISGAGVITDDIHSLNEPDISNDNYVVAANGRVISHSTTTHSRNGNTVTQYHKV